MTAAAWNAERARAIIDSHRSLRGALLPMLHALQEEFGYVDDAALPLLADCLNLSQAEVHGVVTFYHEFRHAHPGRHVVRVCVAEACQARGADHLVAHLKSRLGIGLGQTSADASFTLEAVYCLGNCALGPSALVDDRLMGRLTPAGVDGVLA